MRKKKIVGEERMMKKRVRMKMKREGEMWRQHKEKERGSSVGGSIWNQYHDERNHEVKKKTRKEKKLKWREESKMEFKKRRKWMKKCLSAKWIFKRKKNMRMIWKINIKW